MRKFLFHTLIASVLWLVAGHAHAQYYSHTLIYTLDNVRFTVYLDGQKINPVPQTRVRCINLEEPFYKLRIVFEDKGMEPIERSRFFLRDTYGYPVALEHQLKRNKKGRWKMKWKAQESWPGKAVAGTDAYAMPNPEANRPMDVPCNGKSADKPALDAMLQSIRPLDTDEAKLPPVKQFVSSNCITVEGLKTLLQALGNESTKLELAQYAYPYTVDKGNYFQLNGEFKEPKSVEALYRSINK